MLTILRRCCRRLSLAHAVERRLRSIAPFFSGFKCAMFLQRQNTNAAMAERHLSAPFHNLRSRARQFRAQNHYTFTSPSLSLTSTSFHFFPIQKYTSNAFPGNEQQIHEFDAFTRYSNPLEARAAIPYLI